MLRGIRSASTGEPGRARHLAPLPPGSNGSSSAAASRFVLPHLRSEDSVQPNRSKAARPRRPWVSPVVTDLPRLTDLTLTTGTPIPGGGDTGGTGSTVTP